MTNSHLSTTLFTCIKTLSSTIRNILFKIYRNKVYHRNFLNIGWRLMCRLMKQQKREMSILLSIGVNVLPIQHLFVFKVLWLFFLNFNNRGNDNLFYNTRNIRSKSYRLPKLNKALIKHSPKFLALKHFNQFHLVSEILSRLEFSVETQVTLLPSKEKITFLSYLVCWEMWNCLFFVSIQYYNFTFSFAYLKQN